METRKVLVRGRRGGDWREHGEGGGANSALVHVHVHAAASTARGYDEAARQGAEGPKGQARAVTPSRGARGARGARVQGNVRVCEGF